MYHSEEAGGSRFIHYTTHIAPNFKSMFFAEGRLHTHTYMSLSPYLRYALLQPFGLAPTLFDVKWGDGEMEKSHIDYARYAHYKFKSLSITHY